MRCRTRRDSRFSRTPCGVRTRRAYVRLVGRLRLCLHLHFGTQQRTSLLADPLEVATIGIAMRVAWRSLVGSLHRSEVGMPTSGLDRGPVDGCPLDRGPPHEQNDDAKVLSKDQRCGSLDVAGRRQLNRGAR